MAFLKNEEKKLSAIFSKLRIVLVRLFGTLV